MTEHVVLTRGVDPRVTQGHRSEVHAAALATLGSVGGFVSGGHTH